MVLGFHVVMETVLGCKIIEIVIYLLAACVYRGPVELRLKGPGVVVRRNIAGTAIPRRDMFFKVSVLLLSPSGLQPRDYRIKMPTNLPRIPILPPRPRYLWILLINCQAEIRKVPLQFICEQQP